jgi:hypothetical protein
VRGSDEDQIGNEKREKWGKNEMKQGRPETRPHETKGRSEEREKNKRRLANLKIDFVVTAWVVAISAAGVELG